MLTLHLSLECQPLSCLNQSHDLVVSTTEGLWLFSSQVVKPYIRDDIAVPFSACYIFDKNVKSCSKPSFCMTTDLERSFTDSEMLTVVAEIKGANAIGYAADGCGLQWISFDDELTRLIRQGFETWLKAIQKI